jgi:hypothetical protein
MSNRLGANKRPAKTPLSVRQQLKDPSAPFDPLRLWSTGHKHDGRKVVLVIAIAVAFVVYLTTI